MQSPVEIQDTASEPRISLRCDLRLLVLKLLKYFRHQKTNSSQLLLAPKTGENIHWRNKNTRYQPKGTVRSFLKSNYQTERLEPPDPPPRDPAKPHSKTT